MVSAQMPLVQLTVDKAESASGTQAQLTRAFGQHPIAQVEIEEYPYRYHVVAKLRGYLHGNGLPLTIVN